MKKLRELFGGKRKPVLPVAATMKKEPGNIYVLRINGVLNKTTVDRIQTVAAQEIEQGTKNLKLLVILSGFEGWSSGDSWGDIDFFARYGNDIVKIAAVGEAKWREQMLLFMFDGRRRGEVRYFASDEEPLARIWLVSQRR